MQSLRTTIITTLSNCLLTLLLLSCSSEGTLLHHFVSLDGEEWAQRDSISFRIDSVAEGGAYSTTLQFRSNANYPYRNISIVMRQQVRHSGKSVSKTINYDIVDSNGKRNGDGLTYKTHEIPFCTMNIQQGDTVDVVIRHNMKDNILPGIADVGVLIEQSED